MDFLLSRNTATTQKLEAYRRDGTFLWSIDLGPNSTNKNNISPGSTTINVGQWDGATAYDLDGDGKAEVIFRIANGVTFGDGTVWTTEESDSKQWLAIVDGMTGELKAYSDIPEDYI
ncbi:rhamnogalacturonan lyase family protein [Paenibacillus sp. TY11]|uniref:rhamnogalacturonan lyase family protein n=1 Tax=Paenibacillus sp. TY11 TaxID=3448633 RepID=UPI00403912FD